MKTPNYNYIIDYLLNQLNNNKMVWVKISSYDDDILLLYKSFYKISKSKNISCLLYTSERSTKDRDSNKLMFYYNNKLILSIYNKDYKKIYLLSQLIRHENKDKSDISIIEKVDLITFIETTIENIRIHFDDSVSKQYIIKELLFLIDKAYHAFSIDSLKKIELDTYDYLSDVYS